MTDANLDTQAPPGTLDDHVDERLDDRLDEHADEHLDDHDDDPFRRGAGGPDGDSGDGSGDRPGTGGPGGSGTPPRKRRKIDKSLLVMSLVIAVGAVLVARGLAIGLTGDERVKLPEQVEQVDPVPEAVQVLNQTRVFADLATGYTGVLVIDGVEIPTIDIGDVEQQFDVANGEQVDLPPETIYEAGNATLTFLPSDDALITGFDSGLHRAQVIFWRVDESRQHARSFTWTFNVV